MENRNDNINYDSNAQNFPNISASEFLSLLGLTPKDRIVIGKQKYIFPNNRLCDADHFRGRVDIFFTPSAMKKRRKKVNVVRCSTCYADLDFRDYDRAMQEVDQIKDILESYGFYYAIMCSGRGLHIYVPVNMADRHRWEFLNEVLNKVILAPYYRDRITDRSLITNSASLLRLPGTINGKNKKPVFVVCHNIDEDKDYFQHNHDLLRKEFVKNENKPVSEVDEESVGQWDFSYGSITSQLLEKMLALDLDIVELMREKREDRELNNHLFKNLAAYLVNKPKKFALATDFVERIGGDKHNLQRWLNWTDGEADFRSESNDHEPLRFNAKELLNWAKRVFPGTKIEEFARQDYNRLLYSNGYYRYIEKLCTYDSLDRLREDLGRFVGEKVTQPGVYWIISETGVGKTTTFQKLSQEGKRVVFLVPYLMLLYNLNDQSAYTYDSIEETHRLRNKLMGDILDAEIIVIDEAHCIQTFQPISEKKRQIMRMVDETIRKRSIKVPVFMLTSTPSIEQIPELDHAGTSKFIGFLRKQLKKVSIEIIDRSGLKQVIQRHKKILMFIDDKREVAAMEEILDKPEVDHNIFTITSETSPEEKQEIEKKIQNVEKFIIIGTSSVSSGINIPLETIVFSNRIMVQLNLYQVLGRLRIVNDLKRIYEIYIMNMPTYKLGGRGDRSLDLFEFVSPALLIRYISKLYHVVELKDNYRVKERSFTNIKKLTELESLIKSTNSIGEFYRLPRVLEEQLHLIPMRLVTDLGESGWLDQNGWLNVPYKDVKKRETNDQVLTNIRKIKVRNKFLASTNPIYHYLDPEELLSVLSEKKNGREDIVDSLPKVVRQILKTFKDSTED